MNKAHELSTLLIQVAELGKETFVEAANLLNLPVPVARAILFLDDPAPMSELAESLTCDRSYVTNITDQLENLGLVTRITGTDRRVKLLQLTDAGKQTRDKLSQLVADRSLVYQKLNDTDRTSLENIIRQLLEN